MIGRRAAGLLFGLPLVLVLSAGIAAAQDSGTTIVEDSAPAAQGRSAAGAHRTGRCAQALARRRDLGDRATPPSDEITPTAIDEGAGWEAAVEAAQAATPLIGAEQAKAIERINAYFNNITNLQGSFEQVDSTDKRTTGRFYVQRPGKIRFDYAPPSGLRIIADGKNLAIEDSDLKTVEKYPIQSTPFRLLLADVGRPGPRCAHRGGRKPGGHAVRLARGQVQRRRRHHQAGVRQRDRAPAEAVADYRRPGLDDQSTVNDVVSGRKVAADFFTSKENFQPFR